MDIFKPETIKVVKGLLADNLLVVSIGGIVLICLALLLLRKLVSYEIECWFCSKYVPVNIFKRNSFMCTHCEQYNGFTEDGDYNKPMPAMYNEQLNQRRVHTEVVGQPTVPHNFLCDNCQANQINKIQQLAAFVPLYEASFEAEFTEFKGHLEDIFQLCPRCLLAVNKEIERQDLILGPRLQAYWLRQRKKNKRLWLRTSAWGFIFVITGVRLATVYATFCLYWREKLLQYGKIEDLWMKSVDEHRGSVALAGLSLFLLSTLLSGRERLKKIDGLLLVFMSLMFLISLPLEITSPIFLQYWHKSKECHFILSALSVIISAFWTISHLNSLVRSRMANSSVPSQPVEVGGRVDGSYISSGAASENEREEEFEEAQETSQAAVAPSGVSAAGNSQDVLGPSNSRGPVRDGMGSLSLGPRGNVPNKRNDLWTTHIHGDQTPPLADMVRTRPVVHPARFNYASGSLPGSAASSVVDGPTSTDLPNLRTQRTLMAQSALRAQYALRAKQERKMKQDEEDDESTSGIDGSADDIGSSISRRGRRRGDSRRGKTKGHKRNSGESSQVKSLLVAVLFGISIGLNLSAALYLQSVQ